MGVSMETWRATPWASSATDPQPGARSQPARVSLTTSEGSTPAGHEPERRLSSGLSRCVLGYVRLWGEGRDRPGHIGTVLSKGETQAQPGPRRAKKAAARL